VRRGHELPVLYFGRFGRGAADRTSGEPEGQKGRTIMNDIDQPPEDGARGPNHAHNPDAARKAVGAKGGGPPNVAKQQAQPNADAAGLAPGGKPAPPPAGPRGAVPGSAPTGQGEAPFGASKPPREGASKPGSDPGSKEQGPGPKVEAPPNAPKQGAEIQAGVAAQVARGRSGVLPSVANQRALGGVPIGQAQVPGVSPGVTPGAANPPAPGSSISGQSAAVDGGPPPADADAPALPGDFSGQPAGANCGTLNCELVQRREYVRCFPAMLWCALMFFIAPIALVLWKLFTNQTGKWTNVGLITFQEGDPSAKPIMGIVLGGFTLNILRLYLSMSLTEELFWHRGKAGWEHHGTLRKVLAPMESICRFTCIAFMFLAAMAHRSEPVGAPGVVKVGVAAGILSPSMLRALLGMGFVSSLRSGMVLLAPRQRWCQADGAILDTIRHHRLRCYAGVCSYNLALECG
jgi:hypothetical protein